MSRIINLLDYIPPVLADVEEQQQISKALTPEINLLWAEIQRVEKNQFLNSSDEYGVSRRENQLNIRPKNTETLDERKFRLSAKELEKLPYTFRILESKLKSLCGEGNYRLNVDYDNRIVTCRIALESENSFKEVESLLDRVIPLDMTINAYVLYNTYDVLSQFTYEQLKEFTYDELRSKELYLYFNEYDSLKNKTYEELQNYIYEQLRRKENL